MLSGLILTRGRFTDSGLEFGRAGDVGPLFTLDCEAGTAKLFDVEFGIGGRATSKLSNSFVNIELWRVLGPM